MSTEEELLEACRLAPGDDAPRLVWADAVGGERGELVVIQCDLARGGLPPAAVVARRDRERALLLEHGPAWAGIDRVESDLPLRFEYRRGFIEAMQIDGRMFVRREAWRRTPLLSCLQVDLSVRSGDPLDDLAALLELLARPGGPRPSALELGSLWSIDRRGLTDDAVRLLVEEGALARLSALGISRGLTDAGAHALLAAGGLEHLERLRLNVSGLSEGVIRTLLASMPRLRWLHLVATDLAPIAAALPPVTELGLSHLSDASVAALGASRAAATVETLHAPATFPSVAWLRAFPRLRELVLAGRLSAQLRPEDLAAAAPSLRRLHLTPLAPLSAPLVFARVLGPQLEELTGRLAGDLDELRACVPGGAVWHGKQGEPFL